MHGQNAVDMRLKDSQQIDETVCYNIDIRQSLGDESIMLAGQNYRFFYSSESLGFDESGWHLRLSDDEYSFNLVQHRNKVDASKVGVLSFDKNLGFINASVILNGTNSRGIMLQKNKWITLAEMCFNVINEEADKQVIIARPELTVGYGRAYVELSYVDQEGFIQSLPIQSAQDIE